MNALFKKRSRYELVEPVASGGFSQVYRAYDRQERREVCVKVMDRDVSVDVAREVAIMESLRGVPGTVQLIDYFATKRHFYIVMELETGGECYHRVVSGTPGLPEVDARLVIRRMLEIVLSLHQRNIVHRDIKAENVLYRRPDSQADDFVVADFGLAAPIDAHPDALVEGFAGSAGYTAPETYVYRAAGRPADIWSVGLVAYAVLVGGTPFLARDPAGLCQETLSGFVRYPAAEWVRVSPLALDFVQQCLRFNPCDRMTAAEALRHPWICPARSTSLKSLASSVSSFGRSLRSRSSTRSNRSSTTGIASPEMLDSINFESNHHEYYAQDERPLEYPVRPEAGWTCV